jgi:iron complex outermembrane receptor protein
MNVVSERLRCVLLACICTTCLFHASAGFGQESANAPATGAGAAPVRVESSPGLEEVVVTAQRRSENIRDVPISITALTGDDLAKSGIKSTQDLVNMVPGLHMDRVGFTTLPSIRGVTTFPTVGGVESNVALYVDNIYEPASGAATMDLADVSRVDVLKGPQGTLFGRNVVGGAIQIFTKDPDLKSFGGEVSAGYGNYNHQIYKGFVSAPIVSETLAVSLSGFYESMDNYYDNLTPDVPQKDIENNSLRAKVLWVPTDSTRITLIGFTNKHSDPSATMFEPLQGVTSARNVPGAIIPTKTWQIAGNVASAVTQLNKGVSVKLDQGTSWGDLTVLGSYSQARLTEDLTPGTGAQYPAPYTGFNYGGFGNFDEFSKTTSKQAEVVFASRKFGDFSFVAGANYFDSENIWTPMNGITNAPGVAYELAIYGGQTTTSYAVFGEGTYQFTDNFNLTAGVRYSHDDRAVVGSFYFGSFGTPSYPEWDSKQWSKVTQRVSLNYKITPETNAYFTYSTGFQSGNFDNTTIPINTTPAQCDAANAAAPGSCALPNVVDPQEIESYEIGVKSDPTPWLRLNAALYAWQMTNMQISLFQNVCLNAPCPPNQTTPLGTLANAATTNMYGAEFSADAQVTDSLRFNLGVSLLDATFSKYDGASWNVPADDGAGLVPTPAQSAAGKQVPRSPKASLSLAATYTKDTPVGQFALNATGYTSERVYLDVGNVFYQPAYTTLNLRAEFSPEFLPGLTLSAWGNNVTDTDVILGTFLNSNCACASYQPPATYGVTVDYKF